MRIIRDMWRVYPAGVIYFVGVNVAILVGLVAFRLTYEVLR